jgi:prevent-host-death family protein
MQPGPQGRLVAAAVLVLSRASSSQTQAVSQLIIDRRTATSRKVEASEMSCLDCLDRGGPMRDRWQLQEAKQRFSELIRSVEADGPQFVTRHGEEVAVVVSIAEYRHLRGRGRDFKEFLQSAPDVSLDVIRPVLPAPRVELDQE